MSYVGIGGAAVSIVGGIFGASSSNAQARAAAEEKARLGAELNRLENSRQAIVNPWATTKDMSSLIKDSSSLITNPFANLGVATQASKFEAEQIDVSLANTLDTLRETGSSAGGATALANAALKAKQGISANIEQQEAKNDQLRAKGQQDVERIKLAEAQRIQGAQLSEAQRVQGAEAAGQQFMFNARETREQAKIDRIAGLMGAAGNREDQARANATSAITGAFGSVASSLGTLGNTLNSK
jgi:DNA-directed RNA polymerase beta' subunit